MALLLLLFLSLEPCFLRTNFLDGSHEQDDEVTAEKDPFGLRHFREAIFGVNIFTLVPKTVGLLFEVDNEVDWELIVLHLQIEQQLFKLLKDSILLILRVLCALCSLWLLDLEQQAEVQGGASGTVLLHSAVHLLSIVE